MSAITYEQASEFFYQFATLLDTKSFASEALSFCFEHNIEDPRKLGGIMAEAIGGHFYCWSELLFCSGFGFRTPDQFWSDVEKLKQDFPDYSGKLSPLEVLNRTGSNRNVLEFTIVPMSIELARAAVASNEEPKEVIPLKKDREAPKVQSKPLN